MQVSAFSLPTAVRARRIAWKRRPRPDMTFEGSLVSLVVA